MLWWWEVVCICLQFQCILYRYFRTDLSAVASEVFIIRATRNALLIFRALKRRMRRVLAFSKKTKYDLWVISHAWNQILKCQYQGLARFFSHDPQVLVPKLGTVLARPSIFPHNLRLDAFTPCFLLQCGFEVFRSPSISLLVDDWYCS